MQLYPSTTKVVTLFLVKSQYFWPCKPYSLYVTTQPCCMAGLCSNKTLATKVAGQICMFLLYTYSKELENTFYKKILLL